MQTEIVLTCQINASLKHVRQPRVLLLVAQGPKLIQQPLGVGVNPI